MLRRIVAARAIVLPVACILALAGRAWGQACEPIWHPTFGGEPGVNSPVNAMLVFDDGAGPALYVGGEFETANGVAASCIAKWDGTTWSALGSGLGGFYAHVNAVAVFDDGGGPALYAAGQFAAAGGLPATNIAKWDGSSWSAVGAGLGGLAGEVNALAVFDDGSGPALFAGGKFISATSSNVARWDGLTWSDVGGGMSGGIKAFAVFDDGTGPVLCAGGNFTTAGGVAAKHVARWDGAAWSAMDKIGPNVQSLVVYDDGSGAALYAGGTFVGASGQDASRIVRWTGATWVPVGGGVTAVDTTEGVHAMTVFDDGSGPALYVTGGITAAGAVPVSNIARWDGTNWSALDAGLNAYGFSLAAFDAGGGPRLYVGGGFDHAGETPATCIATWSTAGWEALGNGLNGDVYALASYDDGSGAALHVAGNFTAAGDVTLSGIAKWNGQQWSALGGGIDGSYVHDLIVFDDGAGPALFAAGNFTSAGSASASDIARWNGTAWSSVGGGVDDPFGRILSLAAYDDGTGPALYAGGQFTSIDGVAANAIARWNGSSWSPVGSGLAGPNAQISDLAVANLGDGPKLYAAGFFALTVGTSLHNVAAWDGSHWSILGSWFSGDYGAVFALSSFDDGHGEALYAGGGFTEAGGVPAHNIAKWNGLAWSALGGGLDDACFVLGVYDDGVVPQLYAGGEFLHAGIHSSPGIGRWNGESWYSVGSGVIGGTASGVTALAVFDDGGGPMLYAGGSFTSAPDSGDSHIAKWGGCAESSLWTDLGYWLIGVHGAPKLVGTGSLTPGSSGSLALSNAAPTALSVLFASTTSTPTPFKCGTLVPVPIDAVYLLATDPLGNSVVPWMLCPAGLSGLSLYFQCAVHDSAAACGVSLSNALRADVP